MARAAVVAAVASTALGSVRYDPEAHVAVRSAGCGKPSPYAPGRTTAAAATFGGVEYAYRVYVPWSYDGNTPMALVTQHNGWGVSAKQEQTGSGVSDYADEYGYVAVFPQGRGDNLNLGGPWYSWNAVGSTQSPGQAGATCTNAAGTSQYCYTSCGTCSDGPQCWWTTCDNEVTPTGTGRTNVNGYIPSLYDTLESQLCIDTTREFAAGESNGGMMTYQLGVDMSSRLAAVVSEFGSFHRGFNELPLTPVPILEFHGTKDTTVPANVSLSGDGYYYTPVNEIYYGNVYAPGGWTKVNGCSPTSASHYRTSYDGVSSLYCVGADGCINGDVVRCSWNGGHTWFANSAKYNGGLVSEFLMKWSKPSHVGFGCTAGEECDGGNLLETEILGGDEETSPRATFEDLPRTLTAGGHYGDPRRGCLADEDVLPVGTGRTCGPRIRAGGGGPGAGPPTPACRLGGAAPLENGCPTDAPVDQQSRAWPICLAKGNVTDPYTEGQFHCMLVCPCSGDGNDCGAAAHAHCPQGAICERGELRHMGHGVCSYRPWAGSSVIV